MDVLNVSYSTWAVRLAAFEVAVDAKNKAIEEHNARNNRKMR